MAGMISRRPLAGFAAALIFTLLGLLLTSLESAPGSGRGMSVLLFGIVGYFLLFVAALSFVSALYTIRKNRNRTHRTIPS